MAVYNQALKKKPKTDLTEQLSAPLSNASNALYFCLISFPFDRTFQILMILGVMFLATFKKLLKKKPTCKNISIKLIIRKY